jgi:hypothetical protein
MWDRVAGSRSIGKFGSGSRQLGALVRHFFPEHRQTCMELGARGIFGPGARTHDQIDARQLMLMQSKRFADDPPDTVALDAAARGSNRDGKPETRPALVVPERSHAEESIAKTPPARVGSFEVRLATKAPLRGECEPSWGRAVAGQAQAGASLLEKRPAAVFRTSASFPLAKSVVFASCAA